MGVFVHIVLVTRLVLFTLPNRKRQRMQEIEEEEKKKQKEEYDKNWEVSDESSGLAFTEYPMMII